MNTSDRYDSTITRFFKMTKKTVLMSWFTLFLTSPAYVSAQTPMPGQAITAFGRDYDLSSFQMKEGTYTLTAYNLDRRSTGKNPGDAGFGITSTGTTAATGRTVAVDPSVIPYGALLYIDGVGWRVAEDTGGAIRGHHIDVLMDSRDGAMNFGVKKHCHVEVYLPTKQIKAVSLPNP